MNSQTFISRCCRALPLPAAWLLATVLGAASCSSDAPGTEEEPTASDHDDASGTDTEETDSTPTDTEAAPALIPAGGHDGEDCTEEEALGNILRHNVEEWAAHNDALVLAHVRELVAVPEPVTVRRSDVQPGTDPGFLIGPAETCTGNLGPIMALRLDVVDVLSGELPERWSDDAVFWLHGYQAWDGNRLEWDSEAQEFNYADPDGPRMASGQLLLLDVTCSDRLGFCGNGMRPLVQVLDDGSLRTGGANVTCDMPDLSGWTLDSLMDHLQEIDIKTLSESDKAENHRGVVRYTLESYRASCNPPQAGLEPEACAQDSDCEPPWICGREGYCRWSNQLGEADALR